MKNTIMWAVLIFTGTFSQLLFKVGLRKSGFIAWNNLGDVFNFYIKSLNVYFLSGLFLTIISFLLWIRILSTSRLSTAFNISALMYIVMALEAYFFLGEPMGIKFLIGTALITIGVAFCI